MRYQRRCRREFIRHQDWNLYGPPHLAHVVTAMQFQMIADGFGVESMTWRGRPVDWADGWVIEVETVVAV